MTLVVSCWNGVDGGFADTNLDPIIISHNITEIVKVFIFGNWKVRLHRVNAGYGVVIAFTILACILAILLFLYTGR